MTKKCNCTILLFQRAEKVGLHNHTFEKSDKKSNKKIVLLKRTIMCNLQMGNCPTLSSPSSLSSSSSFSLSSSLSSPFSLSVSPSLSLSPPFHYPPPCRYPPPCHCHPPFHHSPSLRATCAMQSKGISMTYSPAVDRFY